MSENNNVVAEQSAQVVLNNSLVAIKQVSIILDGVLTPDFQDGKTSNVPMQGALPSLRAILLGKSVGEEVVIELDAEDLPKYDPALVVEVERAKFEAVPNLVVNMTIQDTASQQVHRVVAINETTVTVDKNHLYAGKTVVVNAVIEAVIEVPKFPKAPPLEQSPIVLEDSLVSIKQVSVLVDGVEVENESFNGTVGKVLVKNSAQTFKDVVIGKAVGDVVTYVIAPELIPAEAPYAGKTVTVTSEIVLIEVLPPQPVIPTPTPPADLEEVVQDAVVGFTSVQHAGGKLYIDGVQAEEGSVPPEAKNVDYYVHGRDNIIKTLEAAFVGRKVGDKFTINYPADAEEHAFGQYDNEKVIVEPIDKLPVTENEMTPEQDKAYDDFVMALPDEGVEVFARVTAEWKVANGIVKRYAVGDYLIANNDETGMETFGLITAINEEEENFTVDFNHPFAGKDVNIDFTVVSIKELNIQSCMQLLNGVPEDLAAKFGQQTLADMTKPVNAAPKYFLDGQEIGEWSATEFIKSGKYMVTVNEETLTINLFEQASVLFHYLDGRLITNKDVVAKLLTEAKIKVSYSIGDEGAAAFHFTFKSGSDSAKPSVFLFNDTEVSASKAHELISSGNHSTKVDGRNVSITAGEC